MPAHEHDLDLEMEMEKLDITVEPDGGDLAAPSPVVVRYRVVERLHGLALDLSSPVSMWIFFTCCNFLNYVDRGAFAGSLGSISDDFGLSNTQGGLLGASFMMGYMVFAPLFGHLSRKQRPAALMAIGLVIWCLATLATGASFDFWSLMIARAVSGIGEASFIGLAPTYIDDIAPKHRQSMWLAIFFSMIPIGAAAGYGVAGVFTEFVHWRFTFVVEALCMTPIALACWFIPHSEHVLLRVGRKPKQPEVVMQTELTFFTSLRMLFENLRYIVIVLGYSAMVFVAGALYFWAPEYVNDVLGVSVVQADLGIGILTVFCGLVGTAGGGYLVDQLGGGDLIAATVCFVFSLLCFPLAFVAFLVDNVIAFFVLMALAELLIFAITSPINTLCLSVVETENRSFSITMQIFFIHLLGDFPSPFVIGAIADHTGSLRTAMVFCCMWMLYGIFFFGMAIPVINAYNTSIKPIVTNSSVTIEAPRSPPRSPSRPL